MVVLRVYFFLLALLLFFIAIFKFCFRLGSHLIDIVQSSTDDESHSSSGSFDDVLGG